MKIEVRIAFAVCVASLFLGTAAQGVSPPREDSGGGMSPVLVTPEPPPWEDRSLSVLETGESFDSAEVRRIVADLPPDAAVDQVELALFELMPQLFRAMKHDLSVIGEALVGLGQQPGAAEAIALHYQRLPVERFSERLIVVSVLGELRRPEALSRLQEVIWTPLPVTESVPEGLSTRDLEEMIQAKAVHGLAYLATSAADEAVREVIANHEALHVRVSAIDAYMWNHGDSRQTAQELFELLPAEMHLYVERPRFHRGMDPREFSRRLSAWRAKWVTEPEPDPAGAAGREGGAQ